MFLVCLNDSLRKFYSNFIGTYEKVEDEEEEVYETLNFYKLKQFLPNLRVVNLWGVRKFFQYKSFFNTNLNIDL